MRNVRTVRWLAAFGILGALAFAAEVMVPEVTEMRDAQKILVSFQPGSSAEETGTFLIRPSATEDGEKRLLPREGLDKFKLALIAQTGKDGKITGFSLVSWKPADKKMPGQEWPQLSPPSGEATHVRGAEMLLVRQLAAAEGAAQTWGFEIISFRKIEAKEDNDAILKAKKEIIEDGGARLVEEGRVTIQARAAPTEGLRYGILLIPVWKEAGKTLDGYDLRLVSTPAPEAGRPAGE